jgi:zinc protease
LTRRRSIFSAALSKTKSARVKIQPYGLAFGLITKATYPAGHPYSWTVIGSMDDLNAASMSDVQEWFKTYYGPSNAVLSIAGDIDANTAREKVEKYFGDIPAGPPIAANRVWLAKMTGAHRQVAQDRVPQARIYKLWNVPQNGSPDNDYLDLLERVLTQGKSSRLYKRLVYDDQIATDVSAFNSAREIGGQFRIQATARPGDDLTEVEKAIDEELARLLEGGPTAMEMERAKSQRLAEFLRGIERVGGFGGKSDLLASNQIYLGSPDAYKASLKRIEGATPEDVRSAGKRWLSDGVYVLEVHPYPKYETANTGADRSKLPELGAFPELRLPRLQHSTLANGLNVVLAERHETPIVNLWLLLDAGYAADQSALPGTAYATTVLLTGGTKSRTALQISDEQGMLGAQLSAFSNLDGSIVRLSALKAKLEPSLALYADVILNPVFPQEDFAQQQKLQLAAIQREKVTGIAMGLRILPALLYGKEHSYGNSLTGSGTEESVAKLTREDLVKFHQTWFRPNNGTLVVVGDTTMGEITPKLEKLFGGWPRRDVPVKNISRVQFPAKPVVYIMDRPGALQSDILVGEVAPPRNSPDQIAIETMNSIFGSDFGARINMNLREDKHWSYGATSILFAARGQQPFVAYAPVQSDKTKESLDELNKEFHGIVNDRPPTAAELQRAQNTMTLALPGSRETVDEVGDSILEQVQFGLPDDYYEIFARKVRALDVPAVTDAAKSTIHPGNLVWVVVGDRAKIEAGIRQLGLGEVKFLDANGNPI